MEIPKFLSDLGKDIVNESKCGFTNLEKTASISLRILGVALLAIAAVKLVFLPFAGLAIAGACMGVISFGILAHESFQIGKNLNSIREKVGVAAINIVPKSFGDRIGLNHKNIEAALKDTLIIGPLYSALHRVIS